MIDFQLLKSIQEKDSTAFQVLYDRYHHLFLGWSYSRVSDWNTAADLMQEFWAFVWLNPDKIIIDDKGSAKSYLSRNVSFRILRHFHKQYTKLEVVDDTLLQGNMSSLSYSHVAEELSVKEIQIIIDGILQKMPAITRRIYELRYLENRSAKETAEILSLKEGTVRNGVSSALSTLRTELKLAYEMGNSNEFKTIIPILLLFLDK